MADHEPAPQPTSALTWTTIEACGASADADAVAAILLTAGVAVRVIGPDEWRDAGMEMPDDPWQVQIPSDALDRAVVALETWDAGAG